MRPLRFGLLSTARIGKAIVDAARRTELAEVVAVGSRSADRAEAFAREQRIPRSHGSYEALLGDADVDAVYVALPNALHVEWSVRALEAGKHVLCEKPLTRDPAEAERAFEAADRHGRLLMEGFMYRHQPQIRRLRELVQGGRIGDLRLVRAQFSFALGREDDVRWQPELGGGSLLDVGSYCVSVARWVAGEPDRVYGRQVLGPTGVDVRFAGVLLFPGDVLAHFDSGFDIPVRHEVEVVGSAGHLRLEPAFSRDDGVLQLVDRNGGVEVVDVPPTSRFALQLENFARAVAGEEPPLVGRSDSVGQARALDALLRSADADEPVELGRR